MLRENKFSNPITFFHHEDASQTELETAQEPSSNWNNIYVNLQAPIA